MTTPGARFEGVWKRFRRGEVHDSLRDFLPALARRLLSRDPAPMDDDDFWALSDVSFDVTPGDALGIIGPNGAGKSTTLKLLSRILEPTRGTVTVTGRVGALIEVAAGFHPDLTGRENVFLQGAIMGMTQVDIRRRFDEIVDFSGVGAFIDTPVKRYSSGMNARLGFAISAHLDPDVLLIDEVLSVGDLAFQQKCHDRLAEIRRAGVPIVFVSHNLQAVGSLCDRALLLRREMPPILGEVQETIQAYTTAAIASTDQRVEVLDASLVRSDDGSALEGPIEPGTWLRLEARLACRASIGPTGVSLVVFRSDNARVFDGVVTPRPEDLVELHAGEEVTVSIRFRANLLRGVYTAGLVLFDEARETPRIRLPGLGMFNVHDRDRTAGFAELEPEGSVRVEARPSGVLPA